MTNEVRMGREGDPRPAVGVAAVDARGVVMAWGVGAHRLLGYQPSEVVGRAAIRLLAEKLPLVARRHFAERAGWAGEALVRHRDGRHLAVRLDAAPLLDADGNTTWFLTATETEQEKETAPEVLKERALAQLPIPLALFDRRNRLVAANEAMTRSFGLPHEELVGLRLRDIVERPAFQDFDRHQEEVLRTGEAISLESYGQAPGDTQEHAWTVSIYPLKNASGGVLGVSAALVDNTEQYWARRRLSVVNEASVRIGSTLDITRTAQELADVAAGRFADFATVDLLDLVLRGEEPASGRLGGAIDFRRVAQQSVLQGCPESVVALGEMEPYPEYSPHSRALIAERPSRYSFDDPDIQRWLAQAPARARVVREYGMHSVMVVPLRARGVTLGMAQFIRHSTPDRFDGRDMLLAEEIVARAAVCVDNARRYTDQRNTALTLQRSMLPQRTPEQSAVDVASRYLPADSRAGVGGDWFDVIPLSGTRVALVVGDVVGHGIQASATMGQLRAAVRTLADVDLSPDELLTYLDDLVIRLGPSPDDGNQSAPAKEEMAATCLYAVYDPVSRRCALASAGHPPPVVVLPDGTGYFPDPPVGPPLGLGGLPFESTELELPEGAVLAFYTDGLVGSSAHNIDERLDLLRRALTRPATSLEQTCDTVLDTLLPDRHTDDVALLVARTRALDAGHVATWELPADPAIVAETRKWVSAQLASWGLNSAIFTTELVVSELVTNAIRYGGAPIQLRLIRDAALICEVSDPSSTSPHLRRARVFDEGGRGLLLVAQLTDRWGTRQTPTGKVIWAEQALPLG
ncbi:SpoIIE family protein phosphatase [Streptomyces sp. NPDC051320]|uniref:SpoIIE family protein phosphatase n=1 Tax=Streptomyces sp. NPDC051320 TaxID=3154644 RepID=UPI0034130A3B